MFLGKTLNSLNLLLVVSQRRLAHHPGGSRNTPSRFRLRNRDKLRPDRPLGSKADLTSPLPLIIPSEHILVPRGRDPSGLHQGWRPHHRLLVLEGARGLDPWYRSERSQLLGTAMK